MSSTIVTDKQTNRQTDKQTNRQTKIRESNVELLRIVAMLIIIVHHFCVHGVIGREHLIITTENISWQLVLTQLVGWGGHMANGIFVMITGFYMFGRQVNYKKIALLFMTMLFYSWTVGALLYGGDFFPLDIRGAARAAIPIWFGANWFVSCYIIFSLFIPYINKLLSLLDEYDLRRLLVLLFLVDILLPTFRFNTFLNGAPIAYFCFMYCMGAYCKNYLIQKNKFTQSILWRNYLIILLGGLGLSILLFDFMGIILNIDILIRGAWAFVKIFSTFITVAIFMYFITIPKFYNKTINWLAAMTLGVYLIHDNGLVRKVIWDTFMPNQSYIYEQWFPLVIIGKALVVYISCVIIDALRQKYIEPIYKRCLEKVWPILVNNSRRIFLQ